MMNCGWDSAAAAWIAGMENTAVYMMDDTMLTRRTTVAWSGLRIVNDLRPLSAYMQAFLAADLTLTTFCDPPDTGGNARVANRFRRMPWAFQMDWEKKESRA